MKTMLKWCKVLLKRKFSELLYLSDARISQTNFPALSGKAAMLKEKHAWLSKQENAHEKLSSTTRLTRAVMFKKENLSSWKFTNSNLWIIPLRMTGMAVSFSKENDKTNLFKTICFWLSHFARALKRKELSWSDNILFKRHERVVYLCQHVQVKAKSMQQVTVV